ncbi:T9SS-dependent choice-of-anchor J family protein [Mesonia ostreae]|uniref:Choice-of-anchor J domain-containing protein n=1 Tax=Mesonia ostreae TaxID=861110 RepID=A0ABU2KFE0_9FLAO|nr:choice-of-anchor J domain-containing protein [Mesonia ostreae]MDT0293378.1 choice-of-anchor J domain-containing protein [Mesonia ostreae]
MKKITLTLAAFAAALTMNAQTTLFEDSFEDYADFAIDNVGDWTLVDVDQSTTYGFNGITFDNSGAAFAFMVFNSTTTNPPLDPTDASDWTARTGVKAMTSFAATSAPNDDWMISPMVTLGTEGNVVTFFAKAADGTYNNEVFDIAISTTDTDPASFTVLEADLVPTAIDWQEFTVALDAYAEQDVYIAIHHKGNDQFGFQIDDFKVESDALKVDDQEFTGFNHYVANNVLTLKANTAISNAKLYNILGQEVISKKLDTQSADINLNALNSGVYLVQVQIEGKSKSFKIVKK